MTNILVLDVETTFQVVQRETASSSKRVLDPSPYHPANRLVSVGYHLFNYETPSVFEKAYLPFYHKEAYNQHSRDYVANVLRATDLLVGHNLKFDLAWLWSVGFQYDGAIYDTMLAEYIMARGQKLPLSLDECCKRRGIAGKLDTMQDYIDKGISFENVPWSELSEYGEQDIEATRELALTQWSELNLTIQELTHAEAY